MPVANPLRRRGLELMEQLHGAGAAQGLTAELKDLCPAFADMTIDWAVGSIMDRPGLDLKTRELVLVASCVTLPNAVPQLRAHAEAALRVGATREEIVETILQLTFYAGGPAVRNCLVALRDILVD
jgi:4-carboxymuconolactone decarboxylase